jgi:site-specific recombinase XerD
LVVLRHGYCQIDRLLDRFVITLRSMGRSPATVRAYRATVSRYAAFAVHVPDELDPVARYVATRRTRDQLKQASLNLELSALRTWFNWLKVADPDAWQPDGYPRQKRAPQRLPRALSDHEVGLLLAAPDLSTFVGFRDHFIMATLYQCGLRASELATLELGSVRIDGFLYVRGKGGVDRLVPFGPSWYGLLQTYLRLRATVRPGKRSALFVTRHGKALRDGRSVWVVVNRYARRALGLACGFARLEAAYTGRPWSGHYPHLLRAAFATELHKRGVNIMALAQLLGHADADTTTHYLGVDITTLRTAAAHHPRSKRLPAVRT